MPAARGTVTAHATKLAQDDPRVTTVVLSERQVLELISVLTVALREKAPHNDGYHIAVWKDAAHATKSCQATPPCEGGSLSIALVRRGKS